MLLPVAGPLPKKKKKLKKKKIRRRRAFLKKKKYLPKNAFRFLVGYISKIPAAEAKGVNPSHHHQASGLGLPHRLSKKKMAVGFLRGEFIMGFTYLYIGAH